MNARYVPQEPIPPKEDTKEDKELKLRAAEHFLRIAESKGGVNPFVQLRTPWEFRTYPDPNAQPEQMSCRCEIPYQNCTLEHSIDSEMNEVWKDESSHCTTKFKQRLVGEKLLPIQNLRSVPEHAKSSLDFCSPTGEGGKMTALIIFAENDKKTRQRLDFLRELLELHENWPAVLHWVCVTVSDYYPNIEGLEFAAGHMYLLKKKYARPQPLFITLCESPNNRIIMVSPSGTVVAAAKLRKRTAESVIHRALKGELPLPDSPALAPYKACISPEEVGKLLSKMKDELGGLEIRSKEFLKVETFDLKSRSWVNPISLLKLILVCKKDDPRAHKPVSNLEAASKDRFNLKIKHYTSSGTYPIIRGKVCDTCKLPIDSLDQFICPFCVPPQHLCFDCGLDADEYDCWDHVHAWVLIQKAMNNEDIAHIRKPEQPQSKIHESATCEGCQTRPVIGVKWKCANCLNFSVCDRCVCALNDTNNPRYSAIKRKLEKKGHDPRTHVYIKVDFPNVVHVTK